MKTKKKTADSRNIQQTADTYRRQQTTGRERGTVNLRLSVRFQRIGKGQIGQDRETG
jgi:hypothetical protein